jgi:hypothetical protein
VTAREIAAIGPQATAKIDAPFATASMMRAGGFAVR